MPVSLYVCNECGVCFERERNDWFLSEFHYCHRPECDAAIKANWEKRKAETVEFFDPQIAMALGTVSKTLFNPKDDLMAQWKSGKL